MEEAPLPQTTHTIDLNSDENQREVKLTLTVGQVKLIHALVEKNIQPKGYEMIKMVYELFERLQIPDVFAEDSNNTEEVFE